MTEGFKKWLETNDITLDWGIIRGEKFFQASCNGVFVTAPTAFDALLRCYERSYLKNDENN